MMTSAVHEALKRPSAQHGHKRGNWRHSLAEKALKTRRFLRSTLTIGLVVSCLSWDNALGQTGASAQASLSDKSAAQPVAALYNGLQKLEASAGLSATERMALVAPAVDAAFDLPLILQNSVGMRFAALLPQERQALLNAFRKFTIARYVSSFGKEDKVVFTISPDVAASSYGPGNIVRSTLSGDNSKTELDYIVQKSAHGYRITDILLNGHISQVAAQRADFSSTLSSSGAKGLEDLLTRKANSFLSN